MIRCYLLSWSKSLGVYDPKDMFTRACYWAQSWPVESYVF